MKTEISTKKIAARIREAREWKGITQVGMAKQLGVARQTFMDLESGKTEAKLAMVGRVAEITERPLTWFVNGDAGIEILEHEHKKEIDKLLMHFARLPHSVRSLIMKQAIETAKFQVEYTKALTEGG